MNYDETVAEQSRDWARIRYRPAIAELLPLPVLECVRPGGTVLDVGTNQGKNALFLAEHGFKVFGIDVNSAAIHEAQVRAHEANLTGLASFQVVDVLEQPVMDSFDAVLLIRVLTCISDSSDWKAVLAWARAHLKPQGCLYVHDFLYSPKNEAYRARYEAGARCGWRAGNFQVDDAEGRFLFIAHHHSPEEVALITAEYESLYFNSHESLSMHGNNCQMFEFLGRKPA